jgi:hypothetical protein
MILENTGAAKIYCYNKYDCRLNFIAFFTRKEDRMLLGNVFGA